MKKEASSYTILSKMSQQKKRPNPERFFQIHLSFYFEPMKVGFKFCLSHWLIKL